MARRLDSLRLLAVCGAAVAALVLTACGDNDGNKGSGATASGTSTTATKQQPATDEGQIEALVARFQEAFTTGEGKVVCDSLTEPGQRDLVAYGHATKLPGQCLAVANALVKREIDMDTKQRTVEVVTVRVRGSQAVAVLKIPGASGTLQQRYRKQNGDWKIGTLGLAATVGATP